MTPMLNASAVALAGRLQPTDLAVDAGQMVALVGPNGGGKTSLLRVLAGIEQSAGTVTIAGHLIADLSRAHRARVFTFLPASRDLVWPIAARDVIALGLPAPDANRVKEMITLFELGPLAERPVDQLSTGERTRVLLARALAPKPHLLLLDEPLSNLDPYWIIRTLDILRSAVGRGASALIALHDIDRLPDFDRALLMEGGVITADGEPARLLDGEQMGMAFGIVRDGARWRIRPPADRRSSP